MAEQPNPYALNRNAGAGGLAQGPGDAIADEEMVRGDSTGLQGSDVKVSDDAVFTRQTANKGYRFTINGSGQFQVYSADNPNVYFEVIRNDFASYVRINPSLASGSGLGGVVPEIRASSTLPIWTNAGGVLMKRHIIASTAGSGAPRAIVAGESRTLFTNEAAAAEAYFALPSASLNLEFGFYVQNTFGIRIVAPAGDTIRPGAVAASAAAGFIRCATAGALIWLTAINATEYVSSAGISGIWAVDI